MNHRTWSRKNYSHPFNGVCKQMWCSFIVTVHRCTGVHQLSTQFAGEKKIETYLRTWIREKLGLPLLQQYQNEHITNTLLMEDRQRNSPNKSSISTICVLTKPSKYLPAQRWNYPVLCNIRTMGKNMHRLWKCTL